MPVLVGAPLTQVAIARVFPAKTLFSGLILSEPVSVIHRKSQITADT
jgi:hypothetical protein